MTPVDIDKLKELLAKATKRPWVKFHSIYGDDVIAIMKGKRPPEGERWKEIIAWTGFDASDVPKRYRHENAELICAAVNSLPALIAKAERVDALDWLSGQTRLELHHYSPVYGDDDDQAIEWRVTEVSGPINDREWTTVGRGETALDAILSARNTLSPKESE